MKGPIKLNSSPLFCASDKEGHPKLVLRPINETCGINEKPKKSNAQIIEKCDNGACIEYFIEDSPLRKNIKLEGNIEYKDNETGNTTTLIVGGLALSGLVGIYDDIQDVYDDEEYYPKYKDMVAIDEGEYMVLYIYNGTEFVPNDTTNLDLTWTDKEI